MPPRTHNEAQQLLGKAISPYIKTPSNYTEMHFPTPKPLPLRPPLVH